MLNMSQRGVPDQPHASNDSLSGLPPSTFEWDLSPAQKAKGFITRWFVEWWLFEILSCVFSAVCMATIFSVLLHYNNRPLPAWKLGLTLNSFISIFSVLSKASLLFPTAEALGQLKWNRFSAKPRKMIDFEIIDSASRGPFGAMFLLANTKGLTLYSVGAAIVLLSPLFDLFFQQIVAYPIVWVKAGNTSICRVAYSDAAPSYETNALPIGLLPDGITLETRVHIRWAWGILPACLLVFSFLFLVMTIIRSKKNVIWKTSALAGLANGLDKDVEDNMGTNMGSPSKLGHMRGVAKELKVQLR